MFIKNHRYKQTNDVFVLNFTSLKLVFLFKLLLSERFSIKIEVKYKFLLGLCVYVFNALLAKTLIITHLKSSFHP